MLEASYRGRRKRPRVLRFEEGQWVDVMDVYGVWWEGRMMEFKENLIRYHFHGWGTKWDMWYPTDSLHVAPHRSITRDWRSKLEKGSMVDVQHNLRWYEARIRHVTPTAIHVMIDGLGDPDNQIRLDWSSERLMFYGAHTWFYRSPFLISNVIWRDLEGTEVYQYRVRGGKTVLVDHILSESESNKIMEEA